MSRLSLINKPEVIRDIVASALQQGGSVTIAVDDNNNTITISSTDNDTTYSAGTGITLNGTEIINGAPDQTVALTGGSNVTITGTYPNFTISATDTDTTYPDMPESDAKAGTATTPSLIQATNLKEAIEALSPAGQQSDMGQTDTSAVDYVKNQPTLGTAAAKNVGTASGEVAAADDARLSDSRQCNNSFDNAATAKTNLSLNNVENKSSATIRGEIVDADIPSGITRDSELLAHTSNNSNPHSVTKAQVGLGNVDNTSDANKPLSTAQQAALNAKIAISDIVDNVTTTTTNVPLSANQGKVLKDAIDNINTLLTSNEASLDTLQEIVDFIETNKATLDSLGISNISGLQTALNAKIATADIKNNLTSTDTDKPLSAAQGKALEDGKVATADIKNNLTSTDTDKPLSAAQGKALQDNKQDNLTHGIANTNTVQIDSANVTDNDFAKFTANGLEGRTAVEMREDLGGNIVSNTATNVDINSSTATNIVTLNITPSSVNSKILIWCTGTSIGEVAAFSTVAWHYLKLYRGSTQLASQVVKIVATGNHQTPAFVFLDDPQTTSQITYAIKGNGAWVNGVWSGAFEHDNFSLIAQEVFTS